jgi:SAM-dependent methyltransferase
MTHASDLERSWTANAANWTRAVREGLIPSRKAGTDAAIVEAVAARTPKRLLDVGCGEGWLCRQVRARTGCACVGVDLSADLVRDAAAADPAGSYLVLTYGDLIAGEHDLGGAFDVAVFNYALFEEDVAPLLTAARRRLAPGGAVIIQTLHPDVFAGTAEGWRIEDFAGFENQDWTPMPWYYRSVASWRETVARAGLAMVEAREPQTADGRILSLLFICEAAQP